MTSYRAFVVDAFTKERFAGNQAAVVLADKALDEKLCLKIAAEYNLSETAFPVPENGDFKTASRFGLRWFTPKTEVPLCGHATLATSHVLFYQVGNVSPSITFATKSGELVVTKHTDGQVEMNFPRFTITSVRFPHFDNELKHKFSEFDAPPFLNDVISCIVPNDISVEYVAYAQDAMKLIVVIDPETTKFELSQLETDYRKMLEVHPEGNFVRGLIVTLAPKNAQLQGFTDNTGVAYDYVSRYFAPWVGIDEDPATGSAQCALAPFWGQMLNKNSLYAFQSYPGRGAQFQVELNGPDRVKIVGKSVTVMEGQLHLDDAATFY